MSSHPESQGSAGDRPELKSRRFWRGADPKLIAALRRHNARMNRPVQRAFSRLWIVFLFGPVFVAFIRTVFRIRVVDAERLDGAGPRLIVACQHFFEWDPLVTGFSILWPRAVWNRHRQPLNLGGHFWMKSRFRRALSWWFGLIGVQRGAGAEQDALRRASEILNSPHARTIAIFPTGPIGRAVQSEIKPGVGYLSLACPEIPVFPVAVQGVRELRIRDVLLFRRPEVRIVIGQPFRALDLEGKRPDERISSAVRRIEQFWKKAEELARAEAASEAGGSGTGESFLEPEKTPS